LISIGYPSRELIHIILRVLLEVGVLLEVLRSSPTVTFGTGGIERVLSRGVMPSISVRPKFISTSPRQVAVGLLMLLIVGSLFLVPEIEWEKEGDELLASLFGASEEKDQLSKILDKVSTKEEVVKDVGPLEGVLQRLDAPRLTSTTQAGNLKQQRREALRIASSLPDKAKGSRKALRQYAAEIEQIVAGKKAGKLQGMAKEISAKLASEKAPQQARVRWMKLSGIKDSGVSAMYDGQAQGGGTFAPKFWIAKFFGRQGYRHHGVWDPTARATVKIRGYVAGENLEKGLVFINGIYNRPLDIRKGEGGSGLRKFFFKQSENLRNSIFTFRLVSKDGQFYDRSYSFYPRMTNFEWNGHSSGSFSIPWVVNDPRIDRYFFVGESPHVKRARGKKPSGFAGAGNFESW
jgi:hypothetical protein